MAGCLIFILEGVKPRANKDQEHDGECEGEIESLSMDPKEAKVMESVQVKKKGQSTFQLRSPRRGVLSVFVLIKDKKSDNSMRQEELYWEAEDREKLGVTGGWVHTGRKKTMTKNLTTRCLKEIKISPGAGSDLKARLALLTPRPKQQAFFKAETYSNMLMQRGFKAFIDST